MMRQLFVIRSANFVFISCDGISTCCVPVSTCVVKSSRTKLKVSQMVRSSTIGRTVYGRTELPRVSERPGTESRYVLLGHSSRPVHGRNGRETTGRLTILASSRVFCKVSTYRM